MPSPRSSTGCCCCARKRVCRTVILVIVVSVGSYCASSSDLAADRKECEDKLIGLSPCLSFVSGDDYSEPPAAACCNELRNNIDKTRKCLCVLVKDRNEPGLGLKINATLALSLPYICHAPAKASDCPSLLHLAPNSADAQVFEQFASALAAANSSTTSGINPTRSSSSMMRGRERGRLIIIDLEMAGVLSVGIFIGISLHHYH